MLAAVQAAPLLDVRDLTVEFSTQRGSLRAVDGASFQVPAGRVVGLVGESGSGKSALAQALLRLNTAAVGGSARLEGIDLLGLSPAALRAVRGARVSMIFQDPTAALNPALTVGAHLDEAIRAHAKGMSRGEARERARALLAATGIPAPEERLDAYPHQLSGGMRQRVMIAMALAASPVLVIADEPTTALDVTVQAQIVDLLLRLKAERGMALLLITHDLGLVAEACDDVVVMYAGQVVERGPAAEVLAAPAHPYTQALLATAPVLGEPGRRLKGGIRGVVPDVRRLPPGCRFQERCGFVQEKCKEEPPLVEVGGVRAHRCHFPQ